MRYGSRLTLYASPPPSVRLRAGHINQCVFRGNPLLCIYHHHRQLYIRPATVCVYIVFPDAGERIRKSYGKKKNNNKKQKKKKGAKRDMIFFGRDVPSLTTRRRIYIIYFAVAFSPVVTVVRYLHVLVFFFCVYDDENT